MNEIEILSGDEPDNLKRTPRTDEGPVLGEWYWVKSDSERDYKEKDGLLLVGHMGRQGSERLMCAMAIGSNFVELRTPDHCSNGHSTWRIHIESFWTDMRHEPNALAILVGWAKQQQGETERILTQIQSITARLGMSTKAAIGHSAAAATTGALVTMASEPNLEGYKNALVLARDTTLPELYDDVKTSNGNLAALLHAQALGSLATVGDLNATVAEIDGRLFSISLYAGLHEDAVLCQDGEPAPAEERLHVYQARRYMDEEALVAYRHGGMEFKDIAEFDKWLCEPENLDRILPYPRTLVAMRVRRTAKERDSGGSLRQAMINIELENADKRTFLYVRNGQRLARIDTELQFDEQIFPDRSVFDPSEPKMVKVSAWRVERFLAKSAWEDLCATYDQAKAKSDKWIEENPGDNAWFRNPHRMPYEDPHHGWHPVDHSSVYFDDAMKVIEAEVQKYNRVAVIIQGLFDRSPILHPHPPVKTWTAEGFDSAIKLIYDGAATLHNGDAPDFEAYRAQCNESLGEGSVTVGQEDAWALLEGARESARRDRDWRDKSDYRPDRFRPHGNPGPGYLAKVATWSKTKGATFRWTRERLRESNPWDRKSSEIPCSITVPSSKLFNVDAYKLGDFRQFFSDRRTRAQYLKWAPLLIAAEEHHAKLAAAKNAQKVI